MNDAEKNLVEQLRNTVDALADALEWARDHIEDTLFDTHPSDRPHVLLERMRSVLRLAGRLP